MEASKILCRLSDPAEPHNLYRRSDPPLTACFTCKDEHLENLGYYYYCPTCDLEFHRSCHLYPPVIKHPFHLLHSLTLTFFDPDSQFSDTSTVSDDDSSTKSQSSNTYSETPTGWNDPSSLKCAFCRKKLEANYEIAYYHCSTCNFNVHSSCASTRPPLTVENLKTHEHTLTLFPRRIPLPCDACGFSLDAPLLGHVYSCMLCNYMVHKTCIYLPRVIHITRHPHRLSYTSSINLPSSGELSCGVCRKTVDVNYGSYSCNKGCHYAVHSKCATRKEVWDGKDLEGVPEEEEEILEPFSWIDEETIQHFSHDHHHLKIHDHRSGGSHENKFCQACTLPMTVSDRFYSCVKCEFVLHETCASLPRKKYHPVHKHPLILYNPFSSNNPLKRGGFFKCSGCARSCCGFMYECSEEDCNYQLDVRCASLPDPLSHDCHPHDLFFNFSRGECMGRSNICRSTTYVECIKCDDDSFLCLQCATYPSVAHYKHDKHPLTLCCGEEEEEEETTDLTYWCEICERKVYACGWFYTCNSCGVTLHIRCLLGEEVHYMKPNHVINLSGKIVEIKCNNGNSRPVCKRCGHRIRNTLLLKYENEYFCRYTCVLMWEMYM